MYRWNISYKQFYVTLNEKWLYESDPNALDSQNVSPNYADARMSQIK